jgi:hypothetical protein
VPYSNSHLLTSAPSGFTVPLSVAVVCMIDDAGFVTTVGAVGDVAGWELRDAAKLAPVDPRALFVNGPANNPDSSRVPESRSAQRRVPIRRIPLSLFLFRECRMTKMLNSNAPEQLGVEDHGNTDGRCPKSGANGP